MKKKILSLLLIATLFTALLTGCGSSSNGAGGKASKVSEDGVTTITIGYLPITHALAVFEAKERMDAGSGKVKIKLQKFGAWTDLMDALKAGKIDGASVLVELALGAVSQGVDLKAVDLGHKDGNVIVVSDKIKAVNDLQGKTFAIPSNQSSHNILLQDMLAQSDITIDDLTVTQLAPSEMPSALASGSIDGYCVAEPFGAQAVVQGFGHVLYNSEDLWTNSLCCAMVLNNSFIEGNKEATDTFIKEYEEAGKALDSTTAMEIAKKYLGQEEKTLETSLKWIHYDELAITKEDYDSLIDKMKKYGINENPPTYEDFVYGGN